MPISAEQWRASVGAANASCWPSQSKRTLPHWEVFLVNVAALLLPMLPGSGKRGTGSKKGVSRGRGGGGGTGVELTPSLLIAPQRRQLLVISGDVELNPGPVYGYLHMSNLDVLVEELSPLCTKWEALGRALNVSEEDLGAIRTSYNHSGECFKETIRKFLQSYHPVWAEVLAALRSMGEDRLCSELKVKYGLLGKSDLDVVANELDAVSTKWYKLGRNIGLMDHTLDRIRKQYSDNHKCLREMLSYKLRYTTTWSNVVAGLRSLGDSQLADYLEAKYCSSLLHESDLDVIVNELRTVSAKWESLGQQLGIPKGYLDDIHRQYAHTADSLRQVIKQWLQRDYYGIYEGLLTWNHVLLALKSPNIGESQLGEYLKEKYLPGRPEMGQGAQVEHYSDLEFMEKVGAGGYGTVSKGRWIPRDKIVAIKSLVVFDEREVRILSSLDHPSIIQYYGAVEEKNFHFIVTEFAENGSIYDYIHVEHKQPSLAQRLLWAKEVVEGMIYLHRRDIIHRDLKSSNVVLTSDLKAKICDLGSSRTLEHTEKQTTAVGTYAWMAPEMMQRIAVSKSCDVYSYGIFLWELITQQQPFSDIFPKFLVVNEVLKGKRPPIPETCEGYLAKLLNCCWQAEGKARPTFEEILLILNKDTPPSDATSQQTPMIPFPSAVTTTDMKPRMVQLIRLKSAEGDKVEIIKTIAPDWKQFGLLMDLDPQAQEVRRIEAEHAQNGSIVCCQEMFMVWLDSPDATWGNLIDLLNDSEHKELTERVKNALGL